MIQKFPRTIAFFIVAASMLICANLCHAANKEKTMSETEKFFPGKRGVLCLTFDDRNFKCWMNALPIFRKYGARASFFIKGEIDEEALALIAVLKADGHTVGLHTMNHADAPEYIEKNGAQAYLDNEVLPQYNACLAAGFKVKSFAYPNNRRNEDTDRLLSVYFTHFRAGLGVKRPEGVALQDFAPLYKPVSELPGRKVMGGAGIGAYYNTVLEDNLAALRKARDNEQVLVFFSHDISDAPSRIGMSNEVLEAMLSTAKELGMAIVGLDDLP
jgi:peptidoglycan/xylan/chitin deacetylase (PgdA/CDA1 family)